MTAPFQVFDPNVGDRLLPYFEHAGVPTSSVTFAGVAKKGAVCVDTTNGTIYQNSGTLANPTWTQLTEVGGVGDFTGTFNGIIGDGTPAAIAATTIAGTDATDATSSTAAAVKTAGGLAVAKKLNVGTEAKAATIVGTDATDATSSTAAPMKTAGGLAVAKKAFIGTTLEVGGDSKLTGKVAFGSSDTALTAIGTDRAGSLALTKQFNNVGTVGASTAGVTLPAIVFGMPIFVFNNGANAMHVYASGSETIDGAAAATGVVLTNGKSAMFFPVNSTSYVSMMGVASA